MSLTARTMQDLDEHARELAAQGGAPYIADALRCLLDTRDPIAALDLLLALWASSHGRRVNQRAGIEESGAWLEQRILREPAISVEHLALELGWLRRFITIHGGDDRDTEARDEPRDRRDPPRDRQPARAPFGARLDQLRGRRAAALARPAAMPTPAAASRGSLPAPVTPTSAPAVDRLPDRFEVRFARWQDAIDALKRARDRRKQGKPPKDRLLDIIPVATELNHLAGDLACSMLQTDGMLALIDHGGELPTFQIALADLVARDGKRVASRIALIPTKNRPP